MVRRILVLNPASKSTNALHDPWPGQLVPSLDSTKLRFLRDDGKVLGIQPRNTGFAPDWYDQGADGAYQRCEVWGNKLVFNPGPAGGDSSDAYCLVLFVEPDPA